MLKDTNIDGSPSTGSRKVTKTRNLTTFDIAMTLSCEGNVGRYLNIIELTHVSSKLNQFV